MEETLSPTWCELLLYDQILMEGSKDDFRNDPPVIIINIYDYNKLVSSSHSCTKQHRKIRTPNPDLLAFSHTTVCTDYSEWYKKH